SASRHARRRSANSACCGRTETPTRITARESTGCAVQSSLCVCYIAPPKLTTSDAGGRSGHPRVRAPPLPQTSRRRRSRRVLAPDRGGCVQGAKAWPAVAVAVLAVAVGNGTSAPTTISAKRSATQAARREAVWRREGRKLLRLISEQQRETWRWE